LIAEKVPVMIGSTLAGSCGAQAPLLKNGPVALCLSPGIHPSAGSFMFSPAPSTLDLGIVTARYYHERGWKKAAFIFSSDGSGQDGERVIDTAFKQPENRDIEIVDVEHFAPSDLSVAAQLAHVKSSGAQVLYVWTSGTPTATVLRDVHDAGIDLPIVTSYSNATYAQMKQYKPFMPRELLFAGLPTMGPNELPDGELKTTVDSYFRAFKAAGVRPDIGQTTAWDAGALIVSALRHIGPNATADQIRQYLASLDRWTGATGAFDFRSIPQRGVNWKSSVLMARWDPAKDTWVGVAPLGG
jgi:branched-chain amino acid transport system substrate-binding protein